ncbi:MAG TPA: terminase small subunit [Candidatus Angelobacter sp.]|nr:terminase small subunit [Candidatus Angelobacter sp.]
MSGGLTIKQERFARQYVATGNATQAAKDAGYSKRVARQQGSENLSKPVVAAEIRMLRNKLAERLDISRDRLINNAAHMAEQAFANQEFGPAIKATELILKAQGYLVERSLNMSVDVTQQHLDALQQYTDERIREALAPLTSNVTEPTQHNVNDRVTDVMESDTDVDATDAGNTR